MPGGDQAFAANQVEEISRATRIAGTETGLRFSVFVGDAEEDTRTYAERLHAALGESAESSVLILVAPGRRRLEVVTGRLAAARLHDRACGLAALSMASSFAGGDLAGGVIAGVRMLADAAGPAASPGLLPAGHDSGGASVVPRAPGH